MPSTAYQEIVQRIPLLTPEEKERLASFLQIEHGESDKSTDAASTKTEENGTASSPIRLVPVRSFDEDRKWISQHREQYRGQFVDLGVNQLLVHRNNDGDVINQARRAGSETLFVTYIETKAEEHYLSGWLNS